MKRIRSTEKPIRRKRPIAPSSEDSSKKKFDLDVAGALERSREHRNENFRVEIHDKTDGYKYYSDECEFRYTHGNHMWHVTSFNEREAKTIVAAFAQHFDWSKETIRDVMRKGIEIKITRHRNL